MKETKYLSIKNIFGLGLYYEDQCIARTKRDIETLKMMIKEFEKNAKSERGEKK